MSETTDVQEGNSGQPNDLAERLGQVLDEWRSRIDELIVQLDLADMDVRDELSKQLSTAQNAGLAVWSGLTYAGKDVAAGVTGQRASVTDVLHDLQSAYQRAKTIVEQR